MRNLIAAVENNVSIVTTIGNAKFRYVEGDGEICVADNTSFDRWENSTVLIINWWSMESSDPPLNKILEKVVEMFND